MVASCHNGDLWISGSTNGNTDILFWLGALSATSIAEQRKHRIGENARQLWRGQEGGPMGGEMRHAYCMTFIVVHPSS